MLNKSTLEILIVEDDLSFAIELEMIVQDIGYQVKAIIDNSSEAIEVINSQLPDLILMDIDIKGTKTGIEVAEEIQHLNIPVLFITSFNQEENYARAKHTNAIGYIVKPINKYTLRSFIQLATQALGQSLNSPKDVFSREDYLYFKKKEVFYKIAIFDILFIQANDDYTRIFTDGEDYLSTIRISEFEGLLEEYPFIRVHRSFIINKTKASSMDTKNNKIFIKDHVIPISRRMKSNLLEELKFLRG